MKEDKGEIEGPLASNGPFWKTTIGQWVSAFGDGVFQISLAFACIRTGQQSILPLAFLARSISGTSTLLIAGAMVDRHHPRRVLIVSDGSRALAMTAFLVVARNAPDAWALIFLAFVFGIAEGAFEPAFDAATPMLVPPDQLSRANAASWFGRRAGAFTGPLCGAWLVSNIGTEAGFGLDAGTFWFAMIATALSGTWLVNRRERSSPQRSLGRDILLGIRYVRSAKWLLPLIASSAVMVVLVFSGVFVLLPAIFLHHGGSGILGYGGTVSMACVAALISSPFAPRIINRFGHIHSIFVGFTVTTISYGAMTLTAKPGVWILLAGAAGAANSVSYIAYVTILQLKVDPERLGRVFSIDSVGSYALSPIVYALLAWTPGEPGTVFRDLCIAALILVLLSYATATGAYQRRPRNHRR